MILNSLISEVVVLMLEGGLGHSSIGHLQKNIAPSSISIALPHQRYVAS
jgi:hypothetical protein